MGARGKNIYPQKSTFEPLIIGDKMRKIKNKIYKKNWMKNDEEQKYKSEHLSILSKSLNEGTYEGEMKNGLPHGLGWIVFNRGLSYKGEFKNGLPNGQGKETYNNGTAYTGHLKDGKRHGFGMMIFYDGRKYEGEWKDGWTNGKGTYTKHDGTVIEGDFEISQTKTEHSFRTKMFGFGNIIFPNLDTYYGNWTVKGRGCLEKRVFPAGTKSTKSQGSLENILPHGYGIKNFSDGDSYEGDFHHGFFHGQGIYKYMNGSFFEGQFKNGLTHGLGYYKDIGGGTFQGEFSMGCKKGHGWAYYFCNDLKTWASYSGRYEDGLKHGAGILTIGKRDFNVIYDMGKIAVKSPMVRDVTFKGSDI